VEISGGKHAVKFIERKKRQRQGERKEGKKIEKERLNATERQSDRERGKGIRKRRKGKKRK
jgi:hypothetical protein